MTWIKDAIVASLRGAFRSCQAKLCHPAAVNHGMTTEPTPRAGNAAPSQPAAVHLVTLDRLAGRVHDLRRQLAALNRGGATLERRVIIATDLAQAARAIAQERQALARGNSR